MCDFSLLSDEFGAFESGAKCDIVSSSTVPVSTFQN
jgi:hypothetical protein